MLLVALGGLVMAAEGFGHEAAEHPSPNMCTHRGLLSAAGAAPCATPLPRQH